MKNIALYLILYYIFKNACKPLGSDEKNIWLTRITVIYVIHIIIKFALMVRLEQKMVDIERKLKGHSYNKDFRAFLIESTVSNTPVWMVDCVAEMFELFVLLFVVAKIKETVDIKIETDCKMYGFLKSKFKKEIQSVKRLQGMVVFLFILDIYVLTYTALSY